MVKSFKQLNHLQKLNKSKIGTHHSQKTKEKIRAKAKLRKGVLNSFYGKKHKEKTKLKISKKIKGLWKDSVYREKIIKNHKFLKGEKHPNWQGGISFEPYTIDWTKTLKRSIKERDRYVCQLCGNQEDLSVHHIDYNKKNCCPENLITLCKGCNSKVNFNRKYWTEYFLRI